MFFHFFIVATGFVLLIYGADLLVKGASGIAIKFNISKFIIGLTIVSLGTSLPELIITLVSANNSSSDLIIGNVIGSNICNLLLVLGLISIIKPIKFETSTIKYNLPILILINVLILIFTMFPIQNTTHIISSKEGIILLIIAFIYLSWPFIKYTKDKDNNINSEISSSENISLIKCLIFVLTGGFALKYGGDFVVNSSIEIANIFNISKSVIGLSIIALGTSLPELVTSIVAVIKGNEDIAEGNIIGSCFINFTLILGFGAIFSNIIVSSNLIENLILLIASTTLIWLYCLSNVNHILKKSHGCTLLFIFAIYILRLFLV